MQWRRPFSILCLLLAILSTSAAGTELGVRGRVVDAEGSSSARTVVGQVIDTRGEPVPGARVELQPATPGSPPPATPCAWAAGTRVAAPRTPDEPGVPTSDAEGRFTVASLAPGRYRLTVCAAGFAPVAVPGIEIPPPPPRPEPSEPETAGDKIDAGPVDVGTVVLVPGATIAGRIVDADGEPVAEATIRAIPGGHRAISDEGGRFELADLRPGEILDLRVDLEGFARRRLAGVAAPTLEPLAIVLERAGEVAGRVADINGYGIAGVEVSVLVGGRRPVTSRSDDDGSFAVAGVTPGAATVLATADGYRPARLTGVEVPAGSTVAEVELVLEAGAAVVGQVLRLDATPVDSVRVSARDPSASGAAFDTATTDAKGRYQLSGLPPGRHLLVAERGAARVAEEVELFAGDNQIDLRLPARGTEVSGWVLNATAAPVAGARVELIVARGGATLTAETDAGGSFLFPEVDDGAWLLAARKAGRGSGRRGQSIEVRGLPVVGLEIRLESGATVSGRLHGLELDDLSRVRVRALKAGAELVTGADFDSFYSIPDLGPGRWHLAAEVPGTSRRASGRVTVGPAAADVHLDLDFTAGATLSGEVTQGVEPLAGATVSLSGVDVAHHGRTATDHAGSFGLGGLPDGTYRLVLVGHGGAPRHSEQVVVHGDRDLLVELRPARLSGRVLDAQGAPLPAVRVRLLGQDGLVAASATSDSHGAFRLEVGRGGRLELRAEESGHGALTQTLELVDGEVLDGVDLWLEPAEEIPPEGDRWGGTLP